MKRDQFKVQVWNDHDFPWTEMFKGDKVTIPPKSFLEMNFYEAHEFKGQYVVLEKMADETINPKTQKRIRCVEAAHAKALSGGNDGADDGQEVFQCNAKGCRKMFTTESALLNHSETTHAEEMVTDGDAEEALPKKRGRPAKIIEATR